MENMNLRSFLKKMVIIEDLIVNTNELYELVCHIILTQL
jgi:hypothetical protein